MRLFVAVAPPPEVAAGLAAIVAPLRVASPRLKWVAAANYHFTLSFIGELEPAALSVLCDELELRAEAASPFELALGGAVPLPHPGRARVLGMGLCRGAARLAELASAARIACVASGLPAERHPFRPHLTLARARRGGTIPREHEGALPRDSELAWRVSEIVLYESQLRPAGPVYTARARFALGGASPPGA